MSALEQALAAWRNNPSAPSTVALCSYLGPSHHHDLIREVGERASTWHVTDVDVMLAVGRMYLDANLLTEAQAALTQASKVGPKSAAAHRFLGEVLLRRGDAVRAERVLSRAIELGASDVDSRSLHDRASFYTPLQKRVGVQAVASEVARALPKQPSVPPSSGKSTLSDASDTHEVSDIVEFEDVTAHFAPSGRLASNGDPVYHAKSPISARGGLPGMGAPNQRRAAPAPFAAPVPAPVPAPRAQSPRAVPQRDPSYEDISDFVDDDSAMPSFADYELPPPSKPLAPGGGVRLAQVPAPQPVPSQRVPARSPEQFAAPLPAAEYTPPPAAPNPFAFSRPAVPAPMSSQPLSRGSVQEGLNPQPAVVLEHLARVGVFEPQGGAAPIWESAPRQKNRGSWLLLAAIVVSAAAGGGGYEYSRRVKAEKAAEAATLNAEVSKMLLAGRVAQLKETDQKLARSFDLDSRNQVAARLWLENRVLNALFLDPDVPGIDSAVHRGRAAELKEKDLAVGRVASFLVEGDLAGAAAMLPKWDRDAADDAIYQMTAGAVLERAADPRAIERYESARRLDPKLVPADILLARLLLLEQGPAKARPVLDALRSKPVEPAALKALEALSWALDPARSEGMRDSERFDAAEERALPAPLRVIPALVEAVDALAKNELERANQAIARGVSVADSPAMAAALGSLALQSGDEQLARKAALRALSFSALYPRARSLAARVALLGGRLDEAQKATEGLDPSSPDVAVVRGVIAYESLELSDLASARDALGAEAAAAPFRALAVAPNVLMGVKYPSAEQLQELATPAVAWGDVVAVDAALDTGNLSLASTLLGRRSLDNAAPSYRARLARLRRYEGKLDEALAASQSALSATPTASLLIERVYELLDHDQLKPARELVAKHPALLGPMSGWLGVLVDVASNQAALAAVRLTKLEPPPPESPVVLRVLAARALAAAHDKRAKPYLVAEARKLKKHPDIALALKALR
jgi:tetratricopeptide (TPR) repeat protein